jgi:hypothetical protein
MCVVNFFNCVFWVPDKINLSLTGTDKVWWAELKFIDFSMTVIFSCFGCQDGPDNFGPKKFRCSPRDPPNNLDHLEEARDDPSPFAVCGWRGSVNRPSFSFAAVRTLGTVFSLSVMNLWGLNWLYHVLFIHSELGDNHRVMKSLMTY